MFDLFNQPPGPEFDGSDYVPELDKKRLTGQMHDIFELMKDGEWRTLDEIAKILNHPQASISAQLRNFRKERFGGHKVNKRRRGDREAGLFEYQLELVENIQSQDQAVNME